MSEAETTRGRKLGQAQPAQLRAAGAALFTGALRPQLTRAAPRGPLFPAGEEVEAALVLTLDAAGAVYVSAAGAAEALSETQAALVQTALAQHLELEPATAPKPTVPKPPTARKRKTRSG